MPPSSSWETIDIDTVRRSVEKYPDHIPSKLAELEDFRLNTITKTLQERKANDKAYLEKDELLKLVEWKLKHGTFRPNLLKLVSSNTSSTIRTTTAQTYTAYSSSNPTESLSILTNLSGIGPATASLILSGYDPVSAPFFSDELFRYLHADESKDGNLKGWDRKIAYTKKEYEEVCKRVRKMQERLKGLGKGGEEITALELEKLAYVLARSPPGASTAEETAQKSRKRKAEGVKPVAKVKETAEERYPSRKRAKT